MAESDKFFAMSFNHFRRVQADEGPIVLQLVNPPPPCIPEGQLSVEVCSDEYEDTSNMLLGKLSSSDVLGDGGCEQDDTEGEDVVADEEAVGEAPGTEEAVADEEAAFISEGETEDESDMDTSDMLLGKLLADRLASPSQPSSPIVVEGDVCWAAVTFEGSSAGSANPSSRPDSSVGSAAEPSCPTSATQSCLDDLGDGSATDSAAVACAATAAGFVFVGGCGEQQLDSGGRPQLDDLGDGSATDSAPEAAPVGRAGRRQWGDHHRVGQVRALARGHPRR
jgi:hypothetical protein